MFDKAIDKKAKKALALLKEIPEVGKFYLTGGTALAWQIGHRVSYDLDFFIQEDFSPSNLLQIFKNKDINLTNVSTNTSTLRGFYNGCEISFIKFPYTLVDELKEESGINILGLRDIGLMKILAIADRWLKKDFIDLYFIAKFHTSLQELFNLFPIKYGVDDLNTYHYIKSITFFEDADKPSNLRLLDQVNWQDVKEFMINESIKIPKS